MARQWGGEADALLELGRAGDVVVSKRRVCAVLGLQFIGQDALLFVATKVRQVALPVGSVWVVVQSDVIEIPLVIGGGGGVRGTTGTGPANNTNTPTTTTNNNNLNKLLCSKYALAECCFYSANLDLSRPYGGPFVAEKKNASLCSEFVWNLMLRVPFERANAGVFCPPVIQGYCARRKAPEFQCAVIARRSFSTLVMEIDLICWNTERWASFSSRRAILSPSLTDSASGGLIVALDMQASPPSEVSARIHFFDWKRASKMQQGTLDSIARELCSQMAPSLRRISVSSGIQATGEAFSNINSSSSSSSSSSTSTSSSRSGVVIQCADEGKSVYEFGLFFSLFVAAELWRVIERRDTEKPWSAFASGVHGLSSDASQLIASLSAEASDAQTYLIHWRESLFAAGSEMGSLLPALVMLSSPLHRMVGSSISVMTKWERESVEVLLRSRPDARHNSFFVRLTQAPCGPCQIVEGVDERPLTDLRSVATNWVVTAAVESGGSVRVRVPLSIPALVTHWSITFFESPLSGPVAPHPKRCDVFVGDTLCMASVELPHALGPGSFEVPLVFPISDSSWTWDPRDRGMPLSGRDVTFVFHSGGGNGPPAAAAAAQMRLGSISVFGLVPWLSGSPEKELWRISTNYSLSSSSGRGGDSCMVMARSLLDFAFGEEEASRLGSSLVTSGGAAASGQEDVAGYLNAARAADCESLLSLLLLEKERTSFGLSPVSRDQALYQANLEVDRFNPVRLVGWRDATVEERIREAIPSSFLSCGMGNKCRGKSFTVASVARNRKCFQCYGRFCAKCMEDSGVPLLECSGGTPSAPVCFECRAQVEHVRSLLSEQLRGIKLSGANPDSATTIAARNVLQLCAQVARLRQDFFHYPFVRSCDGGGGGGESAVVPLDFCFLPPGATKEVVCVPLSLYWSCPCPVVVKVQLPFRSYVSRITFIAPPNARNGDTVVVSCSGATVSVPPGELTSVLEFPSHLVASTLSILFSGTGMVMMSRICVAFVAVPVKPPLRKRDVSVVPGKEVFGARRRLEFSGGGGGGVVAVVGTGDSGGDSLSGSGSSRSDFTIPAATAAQVQDLLQHLHAWSSGGARIYEMRREVRNQTVELWLVKQRNAIEFHGGFVLRVTWSGSALVRVLFMESDARGNIVRSFPSKRVYRVPQSPRGTFLWFDLDGPIRASAICFRLESSTVTIVPEIWLTQYNDNGSLE